MADVSEKPTARDAIKSDVSQVDPTSPTIEVSDVLVVIDKFVGDIGVPFKRN